MRWDSDTYAILRSFSPAWAFAQASGVRSFTCQLVAAGKRVKMSLESYEWSSYPEYLKPARRRVKWIRSDRLLGEHGIGRGDAGARREFRRRMESLRWEGVPLHAMKGLREGWRFGADDFLEQLIERVELKPGEGHGRKERRETGEQKAERIVCEELERLKWRESDLSKES